MRLKFWRGILLILPVIGFIKVEAQDRASVKLFEQDSLKLVARQFDFTEGPAADKEGNVFFTDQPNNTIWKYDTYGKLSLFLDHAGRANGTYFDKKGNLIACADEHNELWSIDPKGRVKILVGRVNGLALNGPNDLWIDPKGGIYFTDPYFQRKYWTRQAPEMKGEKVYYLKAGQKEPVVADDDLLKPNGIVGTRDGKLLYVGDGKAAKVFKYQIGADGKLSGKQALIDQRSDGMTLDEQGNIYLTGNGVTVYDASGKWIGHIEIKEPWTSNVCFGGENHDILFITASKAVYLMPMKVKGM
ncbi:SMP-30/gluconolactonase/LRE family protein [Pedobacter nutrimenti]|uniref:SMP-30/gluconolactonase/LRE family protein n=1 Tax=Pedobacter nutrimenti TaxID=1241337 RepID=UPI00292D54FF|nr:SMP-30/gluconolactonase/LRE family protein [Pedobacter nutrimenti]